jgi:glycosyltransferase involved in cell wall biosynthesis
MSPTRKPRLLVLSHVLPFPRSGGQQQRVYYTLKAAAAKFDVTFVTTESAADRATIEREMASLCDRVAILPNEVGSQTRRVWHRLAATAYVMATGLKRSNYFIGRVQFPPERVEALLQRYSADCVLFEYWHAAACAPVFQRHRIPAVLDMHDVLWQAYGRQLRARPHVPNAWKRWSLERYKRAEEHAWESFDALVAINREEERYVRGRVPEATVFHAAMGTDLALWPYSWQPAYPKRVAYYGSLGSPHNRADAIRCATDVMPLIWRRHPDVELWLVGANPPNRIRQLAEADRRIHVTGFVPDVQRVLRTMTAVLCPWSGTYGFRSRLVEVMALGVPTVATPDAVAGMELKEGAGLWLGETDAQLALGALELLENSAYAQKQSRAARQQVERLFSLEDTYGRFITDLANWLGARQAAALLAPA